MKKVVSLILCCFVSDSCRLIKIFFLFKIVAVSLLFMASHVNADSDKAYIVMKATVLGKGKKQPTWVAFTRKSRFKHLPLDKPLLSISPGTYQMDHIDFQKNKYIEVGAVFFKNHIKLKLKAGKIYLFGLLEIEKLSIDRFSLNFNNDIGVLANACAASPEIFKLYPLASLFNDKEIKVNCSELAKNFSKQNM